MNIEDQKWVAIRDANITHINRNDKTDIFDSIATVFGSSDREKEIVLISYAPQLLKHLKDSASNPEDSAYWLFQAERLIKELESKGL